MAIKIETMLPGVMQNGLNTAKAVDFSGAATVALPAATTVNGVTVAGLNTVTSASANAFAVGLNGATNPAFNVDASTASSATGFNIKSAAAAGGLALKVISSGTNEALTIDAKGSGLLTLQPTATGGVKMNGTIESANLIIVDSALTVSGTPGQVFQLGGTGGINFYIGTGTPTHSAPQGSIYINTQGAAAGASTTMYLNKGTTNWGAVTSA